MRVGFLGLFPAAYVEVNSGDEAPGSFGGVDHDDFDDDDDGSDWDDSGDDFDDDPAHQQYSHQVLVFAKWIGWVEGSHWGGEKKKKKKGKKKKKKKDHSLLHSLTH